MLSCENCTSSGVDYSDQVTLKGITALGKKLG